MNDEYRWSLDELVTKYLLEPTLRDIFVEGDRDVSVINWLISEMGRSDLEVYKINSVEISRDLLTRPTVSGNKGRVVALCEALSTELPAGADNVRGLVDRDCSGLLNDLPVNRFLLVTDVASLECYALSDSKIQKFFWLYFGKNVTMQFVNGVIDVLSDLFFLRAAKLSLSPPAPWIERFERCCVLDHGRLRFDREDFVAKLVGVARGAFDKGQIDNLTTKFRQQQSPDFRDHVRGHDLTALFGWIGRRLGVSGTIAHEEPVQRAILSGLDFDVMRTTGLHAKLDSWT